MELDFFLNFELLTFFAERISQERHDIMIYMYVGKFMNLVFPIDYSYISRSSSLLHFSLINLVLIWGKI